MPALPASLPVRRLAALLAVAALLVIGVVVAMVAVGGGDDDGGTPRPDRALADAAYQRVLPGLCEATERVAQRDVAGAQQVFVDEAHQALHILSADVSGVDRAVAARLLEAKAAVERDLAQASAPQLARDLPALLSATRDALARLGRSVPDPCG